MPVHEAGTPRELPVGDPGRLLRRRVRGRRGGDGRDGDGRGGPAGGRRAAC
ncbi:hypothetical protein ACRAWF_42420 [Streptomyces sp. L7]